MLNDVFVLDGTCHAYNFSPENCAGGTYAEGIVEGVYGMHRQFCPPGRDDLVLERDTFINDTCDADVTAQLVFGESHADMCIYHELPLYGYFNDGGSPLAIGEEMRERWPGRVLLYGGVSPHQPGALERVDALVEEHGVAGLKLYPHDLVAGELRSFRMDDEDLVFPIFERAEKLGLRTVAIHKAIVMGPVPIDPYSPSEVGEAARAFPQLIFEIVHGGYAFLEETAFLVQWHPNITCSLEGTSALLFRAPRKFAEIIGTLMAAGAADRIIWAIGGAVLHSRAFEEQFWNLEFPAELIDGYGIPPLTEEAKRGILGLNAARLLGIDIDRFKEQTGGDEFAKPRDLKPPWSSLNGSVADRTARASSATSPTS
jgi:predicted TIM-barrel fold metal-dependent hydrolase